MRRSAMNTSKCISSIVKTRYGLSHAYGLFAVLQQRRLVRASTSTGTPAGLLCARRGKVMPRPA
jgi:hypothetical protein